MTIKTRETVKVLRARVEISQEELASKAGLSARTIGQFEKDVNNLRNAKYKTIQKLADGLGVKVNDIFLG